MGKCDAQYLVAWLKERLQAAGAQGLVFGLSGGIDSAVAAALAVQAAGSDALGLILPCQSSEADREDALLVAQSLGLRVEEYDLTPIYQQFNHIFSVEADSRLALANLKARLRMNALYLVANTRNYLVLGTSNRSEITVGYYTKWGDSACDLRPLANLSKGRVRELARQLDIPERIISKPPSAGLWPGQTDEAEMGITYEQIEAYLNNQALPEEVKGKISDLEARSAHKREMPPAPCQNR